MEVGYGFLTNISFSHSFPSSGGYFLNSLHPMETTQRTGVGYLGREASSQLTVRKCSKAKKHLTGSQRSVSAHRHVSLPRARRSLLLFSQLWASVKGVMRLTCSWGLDFIPLYCVSINQRFTIKVKHRISTPSLVIKCELINFLLICMVIKILAFKSMHCPPTRSLIRLS